MSYKNRKPYKALLIDAKAHEIREVEVSDLQSMYAVIGCELVEAVYLNEQRDSVFVDEEGLLPHRNPVRFFYINGTHQPLAGNGLVLGCTASGDSVSPKAITKEWLEANVVYIERLPMGVLAVEAPLNMHNAAEIVHGFFAG